MDDLFGAPTEDAPSATTRVRPWTALLVTVAVVVLVLSTSAVSDRLVG